MSTRIDLTSLATHFLEPTNASHRQYEALRAYVVEGCSALKSPNAGVPVPWLGKKRLRIDLAQGTMG